MSNKKFVIGGAFVMATMVALFTVHALLPKGPQPEPGGVINGKLGSQASVQRLPKLSAERFRPGPSIAVGSFTEKPPRDKSAASGGGKQ